MQTFVHIHKEVKNIKQFIYFYVSKQCILSKPTFLLLNRNNVLFQNSVVKHQIVTVHPHLHPMRLSSVLCGLLYMI